jgi:hypothetical protein
MKIRWENSDFILYKIICIMDLNKDRRDSVSSTSHQESNEKV